jgi:hypothetical protein
MFRSSAEEEEEGEEDEGVVVLVVDMFAMVWFFDEVVSMWKHALLHRVVVVLSCVQSCRDAARSWSLTARYPPKEQENNRFAEEDTKISSQGSRTLDLFNRSGPKKQVKQRNGQMDLRIDLEWTYLPGCHSYTLPTYPFPRPSSTSTTSPGPISRILVLLATTSLRHT